MYMYIFCLSRAAICMRVYRHVYMCVCAVCALLFMYEAFVHTWVEVYLGLILYICSQVYVCMHMYVYVCVYAYVCIRLCVCTSM